MHIHTHTPSVYVYLYIDIYVLLLLNLQYYHFSTSGSIVLYLYLYNTFLVCYVLFYALLQYLELFYSYFIIITIKSKFSSQRTCSMSLLCTWWTKSWICQLAYPDVMYIYNHFNDNSQIRINVICSRWQFIISRVIKITVVWSCLCGCLQCPLTLCLLTKAKASDTRTTAAIVIDLVHNDTDQTKTQLNIYYVKQIETV